MYNNTQTNNNTNEHDTNQGIKSIQHTYIPTEHRIGYDQEIDRDMLVDRNHIDPSYRSDDSDDREDEDDTGVGLEVLGELN